MGAEAGARAGAGVATGGLKCCGPLGLLILPKVEVVEEKSKGIIESEISLLHRPVGKIEEMLSASQL